MVALADTDEEPATDLRRRTAEAVFAAGQGEEFDDPARVQKEIEQQAYREAAEHFMRVFNAAMARVGSRLLQPNPNIRDVLVDFWTVAYATGSFLCNGLNVTQRAHTVGCEKATLSAAMIEFCVGNDLPPSEHMRDRETMDAYRRARLRSIERENERHQE